MPATLPRATDAYVLEDWDNDGDFLDAHEDVTDDVLPGVTVERGRDQGRVTGGPKAPTATWRKTNEDRTYATEYSGSPLHGLLLPGRKAQVGQFLGTDWLMDDPDVLMDDPEALMDGYEAVPVFTGRTEEARERYPIGERDVETRAFGLMNRLINTRITFSNGSLVNFTTGAAMVIALELAGLTSADYVVDPQAIATGYSLRQWIVDDEPAWDVCRRIWASEGPPAALYEGADGRIHFEGRNYRDTEDRSTEVQATFTDADDTYFYTHLEYEPSHWSVINDMTVEVEQRAAQTIDKVWEYGADVPVNAGETVDLLARVNDPLIDIQTPVVTTDYVTSLNPLASVTVTQLSPLTYRIRLVGGAGGTTISGITGNTGIQLRASAVPVVSRSQVTGTFDTAPSRAAYGKHGPPQEISSAIWKNMSEAHAAALIDGYLVQYEHPRAVLRVTLENANGPLLHQILTRRISDRVHVSDSWSGVNLDVTIEQINHTIEHSGKHVVTWHCERVVETDWGRWDEAQWDVDVFGQ